jgi:hypothetical protein
MKSIQIFFEILVNYHKVKTELKKSFVAYKYELSIQYAEAMINLHSSKK